MVQAMSGIVPSANCLDAIAGGLSKITSDLTTPRLRWEILPEIILWTICVPTNLVEPSGIEPLTSCMPCRRSPS